jgi:hypothetical protein
MDDEHTPVAVRLRACRVIEDRLARGLPDVFFAALLDTPVRRGRLRDEMNTQAGLSHRHGVKHPPAKRAPAVAGDPAVRTVDNDLWDQWYCVWNSVENRESIVLRDPRHPDPWRPLMECRPDDEMLAGNVERKVRKPEGANLAEAALVSSVDVCRTKLVPRRGHLDRGEIEGTTATHANRRTPRPRRPQDPRASAPVSSGAAGVRRRGRTASH